MVGDQHQLARRDFQAERAGGVGQDQPLGAEAAQEPQRRRIAAGIAGLVVVARPPSTATRTPSSSPMTSFGWWPETPAWGKPGRSA